MFHRIFSRLGLRQSVAVCVICILCMLLLLVIVGGVGRALCSGAFLRQFKSYNDEDSSDAVHHATHSAILLNPTDDLDIATRSYRNEFTARNDKSPNTIPTDSLGFLSDPRTIERNSYLSTKIVYKPYTVMNTVRKSPEQQRKMNDVVDSKGQASKSKSINSTTAKRITPSITDRVIADLKNEEYLASQQMQRNNDDAKNNSAYDDAIYIDADDEEAASTTQGIPTTTDNEFLEANTNNNNIIYNKDGVQSDSKPAEFRKTASKNVYVGVRDKKSPKKPILIKHVSSNENNGYTDSNDSRWVIGIASFL